MKGFTLDENMIKQTTGKVKRDEVGLLRAA